MLPSKKGQQKIKNIVFSLKMSLKSQVLGTYSHPQCQGFQTFGSARVCAEAYETSWIWNQICRQNWTHLSCCEVNLVCSFGISEKKQRFLSSFTVQLTFFAVLLFITCRGKLPMVIDNGFAMCAPFLDSHVPSVYKIIGSKVALGNVQATGDAVLFHTLPTWVRRLRIAIDFVSQPLCCAWSFQIQVFVVKPEKSM